MSKALSAPGFVSRQVQARRDKRALAQAWKAEKRADNATLQMARLIDAVETWKEAGRPMQPESKPFKPAPSPKSFPERLREARVATGAPPEPLPPYSQSTPRTLEAVFRAAEKTARALKKAPAPDLTAPEEAGKLAAARQKRGALLIESLSTMGPVRAPLTTEEMFAKDVAEISQVLSGWELSR